MSSTANRGGQAMRHFVLWGTLALSVGAAVYTYVEDHKSEGGDGSDARATDLVASPVVRPGAMDPNATGPAEQVQQHNADSTNGGAGTLQHMPSGAGQNGAPLRDKSTVLTDPFAPLAVVMPVQAAAPAAPVVVAAPAAPPLPFQYAGKFEQPAPKPVGNSGGSAQGKSDASHGTDTQTVVYLTRGNDSYAVLPGDAIDASYQFVGIEGETLVFMYLPLATRQTMPLPP